MSGWAYWPFKSYADITTSAGVGSEGFYDFDGTFQEWKAKALARTYLQRTQGTPERFNFDIATGNFDATFRVDTSITEPTILYTADNYYYPNGKTIKFYCMGGTISSEWIEIDE